MSIGVNLPTIITPQFTRPDRVGVSSSEPTGTGSSSITAWGAANTARHVWPSSRLASPMAKMQGPDPVLLVDAYRSMHPWSLHFTSRTFEFQWRMQTLRKHAWTRRLRAIALAAILCVFLVPICQLAAAKAATSVPIATVVVAALAVAALLCNGVFALTSPVERLARWWNVWLFCTHAAFIMPMFLLLITCVTDGLAPSVSQCTAPYADITPLLQLFMGLLSPILVGTLTRASWYVSTVTAIIAWVLATATMIVASAAPDTIAIVGVVYFCSIFTTSAVVYSSERDARVAQWLSVLNRQGANLLERTEGERVDQVRRNNTFLSFANASRQVLYELDRKCLFRSLTASAGMVFGHSAEELLGTAHTDTIVEDDVVRTLNSLQELWKCARLGGTCAPLVLQFRRNHPDGTIRWMEMVAVLEADETGVVIVASERDITTEHMAREDTALRNEQRAAAKAAQAAHEETLGYACHELRNPLHVINAAVEFLWEAMGAVAFTKQPHLSGSHSSLLIDQQHWDCDPYAAPDSARDGCNQHWIQHLSAVRMSARQMRTLVDDILDVEKMRAGKLSIVQMPFSPATAVQETAMQHVDFARVPVLHEADAGLPSVVSAPFNRIQQVLNNGLTNAAKFCSQGVIRVRAVRGSEPNTIRFEVRNSGKAPQLPLLREFGFADEVREAHSQRVKGSGLGLRIAVSLVAAMGGTLHLEDQPAIEPIEGLASTETTFWFQVPFLPVESSQVHSLSAANIDTGPQELGMHVLVVDDEELNRRIANSMLRKLGCTCILLEDGDQVMDHNPHQFDAILMDIVMQRMRGDEIIGVLRASGVTVPCIAVTGNTDAPSAAKYKQAGFDAVLGKPFSVSDIRGALLPYRRLTA